MVHREAEKVIALGVPAWVADLGFPIGFGLIALRLVWHASTSWAGRSIAALGIALGVMLWLRPELLEGAAVWPGLVVLIVSAVCGMPIFGLLGGIAVSLTSAAIYVVGGVAIRRPGARAYFRAVKISTRPFDPMALEAAQDTRLTISAAPTADQNPEICRCRGPRRGPGRANLRLVGRCA